MIKTLQNHFNKSNTQADELALLTIVLLLADVSLTYSRALPQGNVFNHTQCNMHLTHNKKNERYDVQRQKRKTYQHVIGMGDSMAQKKT